MTQLTVRGELRLGALAPELPSRQVAVDAGGEVPEAYEGNNRASLQAGGRRTARR